DGQLDGGQSYGPSIVFSGLSQAFTTSFGYVFLCAKVSNDAGIEDYLNVSINDTDVTMDDDTPIDFGGFTLTDKYLRPILLANYQSNYSVTGTDSPFYRLDLHTNSGSTGLIGLTIANSGTAVAIDFVPGSFKLWHSTSSTFSATRASLLGTTSYTTDMSFSGFTQSITSTTSYLFFTCSVSDTADPSHLILGKVDDVDIIVQGEYNTVGNKITEVEQWPLGQFEDGSVLPVELSLFTSVVTDANNVNLTWVTETEDGVSGYYIYRSATSEWIDSGIASPMIITPSSVQSTQKTYSFTDTEAINGYLYYYWLECVDNDGQTHLFGPVIADLDSNNTDGPPTVPVVAGLNSIYPNPFNPETRISFNVTEPGLVKISVYDIRGRLVRDLVNRNYSEARTYYEPWNGKDTNGKSVAGGVYFIKMNSNGYKGVKKAVLLK
ncbi:MAG: T9SS type A sorting domain-containing protein, partial [Candidatus Zophobacter franzmannii]|nr:T9SS type A sorting domain-containing protein [Candidatus Zophobacter franzmannii]